MVVFDLLILNSDAGSEHEFQHGIKEEWAQLARPTFNKIEHSDDV